jgi:hypothetical protein
MKIDGCFYATFFLGDSKLNPSEDNDCKPFYYSEEEIRKMAEGWTVRNMGNRVGKEQIMFKFVPIRSSMPGISIVTAAFRGELMDKVWESIKNQDCWDKDGLRMEWIIVNDDQYSVRGWHMQKSLLSSFPWPSVVFIDMHRQQGRFGLYGRNIGAMVAKFDRVLFLDDDNEWPTNFISTMVAKELETGLIPMADMHIIGKKVGSTVDRIKVTALSRQNIDLGCLLYRKEHFRKYGYFEDTKQIQFDWDFMYKIVDGEGRDAFVKAPTELVFHHKRY